MIGPVGLPRARPPAFRVPRGRKGVGYGKVSAARMKRYGLIGMCWYNEQEMFSGRYATLTDYQKVIAASP
jgi:hypothetical protein